MMLSPERLLTLFITPSYLLQLFRCLVFLFTEEEMHALVEISNCCHKIVQTHQLDSSPSFDQKYLFTYNNGEGSIGEDLLKYAPVSMLENMSWGWHTERRTVVFTLTWLIYCDFMALFPHSWCDFCISCVVGVPKSRRGEIWQFLALQYRLRHRLPNKHQPPDTSYKDLLKQLTAQQHAILVDLGMSLKWIVVYKSKSHLSVCWLATLIKKVCWHLLRGWLFCLGKLALYSE